MFVMKMTYVFACVDALKMYVLLMFTLCICVSIYRKYVSGINVLIVWC